MWGKDRRDMFVGQSWLPDRQSRCESNPIAGECCSWRPGMYREWLGTSGRRATDHAANSPGRRRALYHLRHLPLYIPKLHWRKYRAWHELCWLPPGWKRCVWSEYCYLIWGISGITKECFLIQPDYILLWFQIKALLLQMPEYFLFKNELPY